ncbi:MAG TPA: hypothetical protein VHP38_14410 [Ruminiclostridium sp.]|nr:hypothetical protein [Ruminiclostridium sp.]
MNFYCLAVLDIYRDFEYLANEFHLGKGRVIYSFDPPLEIQQMSDTTYRIFDYNTVGGFE